MSSPLQVWKGPSNALVETPESGRLDCTDRIKLTQVYRGPYALTRVLQPARGAFGSGLAQGWVVNQSNVALERGGIGKLTIEWEAGGAFAREPLPIGDFSLEPQELYPRIERNGFFVTLLEENIKIACNAAHFAGSGADDADIKDDKFYIKLFGSEGPPAKSPVITDPTQLDLAQKLFKKLVRGEETFYMTGWRYSFEQFSYSPPVTTNGGYRGTPGGPLAGHLPANVAWLRLADHPQPAGVNGSMYKNTVTWLGGPILGGVGYWDSDLYPAAPQ